ncbi:MAG: hypothetical protein QOE33_2875 [Acidobacteriota bacterium]|jgi:hypothetical protein|nr:hypothetical protein [Acidobacteriota bacterium]
MPTNTPPPYFPQASLMPPDPNRWRKIKAGMIGCAALALVALVALVAWLVVHFK